MVCFEDACIVDRKSTFVYLDHRRIAEAIGGCDVAEENHCHADSNVQLIIRDN